MAQITINRQAILRVSLSLKGRIETVIRMRKNKARLTPPTSLNPPITMMKLRNRRGFPPLQDAGTCTGLPADLLVNPDWNSTSNPWLEPASHKKFLENKEVVKEVLGRDYYNRLPPNVYSMV
jgi:hypothetical protein